MDFDVKSYVDVENDTSTQLNAAANDLVRYFNHIFKQERMNSVRKGQTQGYAFLWINIYGKDRFSKALVRHLKKGSAFGRLIKNYRGARNAWYFGSQCDLGYYDALKKACEYLNEQGIPCFVEDAWD